VRRASVNNFGYGGSNAHVILEDYSSFLATKRRAVGTSAENANDGLANGNGSTNGHVSNGRSSGRSNGTTNGHRLSFGSEADEVLRSRVFVLSGKDERATQMMATNLKEYLVRASPQDPDGFLDDLAYTLCHHRSRFPWNIAFSGESPDDLIKRLDSGKAKAVKAGTAPRLGFVYTGQGAQWWAMGRELINAYPVFKAALMDCDTELKKLGTTWNMIGTFAWLRVLAMA
jgi:acyl transferase domain-containing protein